ncbi:MAG: hypothetical protein JOZ58_24120 [Acetobacteraceae bacterium]|nr:hypothetical protein [Acetobacteraceae bacterium]
MPFKLNQDRRRHIPKQKHKITNWSAYDAALRQRSSLTVWFSNKVIAAWRLRHAPHVVGGPPQPWRSQRP